MLIFIQIILATISLICLWIQKIISPKNIIFGKLHKYALYIGTSATVFQLLLSIFMSMLI